MTDSSAVSSPDTLLLQLQSLSVLRSLLQDPLLSSLVRALETAEETPPLSKRIAAYGELSSQIFALGGGNPSAYLQKLVHRSENPYLQSVCRKITPSPLFRDALEKDLNCLQKAIALTPEMLRELLSIPETVPLPGWEIPAQLPSLSEEYFARLDRIDRYGYGIYAENPMFYLDGTGEIRPVRNPDPVRLSELVGYQDEKKVILDNTKALLSGKPAANMLLTGDAGTGKSSTVKAVCNELFGEGLRILELRKEQLHSLPEILDTLSFNPLKFILFIDDLSFVRDDDNFSTLKALLEGSVAAKSTNVVIYATSNRRHLVKERFSDREGDDVHKNDTMQELVSLSERFGLRVTFSRPDKATYLAIVRHLAEEKGVGLAPEKLDAAAERFALQKSIRSARAAKQFVDLLLSSEDPEKL